MSRFGTGKAAWLVVVGSTVIAMSFIAVSARTTNTSWISPEYTQADQDALQRYAEPVEAAQALDGRSSSEDEVLNARDLWLSEENVLLDIYPASIDDHGLAGVKGQIHLAKMAVSQSILHTAERMREAGRFGDASSLLVDGVMIMDRGKYSGFASLAQADKTQEVLINRLAGFLEHLTPEQSAEAAQRLQGVRTSDENRARIAKRLAAAYATEKASGQNAPRTPGVVASLHARLASTPLEDRAGRRTIMNAFRSLDPRLERAFALEVVAMASEARLREVLQTITADLLKGTTDHSLSSQS